jgi:predicted nucleic acid-binding Zn ribbon protein
MPWTLYSTNKKATMKECKYCGAPLDEDSQFCTNCGKKVEPQGKTCPQCGAEVEDDSVFCAKCGLKLDGQIVAPIDSQQRVTPSTPLQEEEEVAYEWEEEKDRTWWYVIGGIVVAAILVFCGYYLYTHNNRSVSAPNVERESIALKGNINETIGFSMKLKFEDNNVEGTEHYDKQKEKDTLSIKGTIDENGNMVLHEYNNNIECGTYEGTFSDDTYFGTFTLNGKNLPFTAQVVSESDLVVSDHKAVYSSAEDKVRCVVTYSKLLDRFVRDRESDDYMDEYYFLYDITGDKIPELWIEVTDWRGDFYHLLYVYTVSYGKLELLYKGNAGHPSDHIFYMGDNYIILDYAFRGIIARFKYEYKGGKIVEKKLFKGSDMDESIQGYYELTEPMVSTSDITNKELLNSIK